MAIFVRTLAGETTVYTNKTTNRQVKPEDLDPAVKEELDLADVGTEFDSETVQKIEGDGVVDAAGNSIQTPADKKSADEAIAAERAAVAKANEDAEKESEKAVTAKGNVNPYRKPVPQSEKGFGFKRVAGKTVDIFDGKTPHTQVRLVGGKMVPLSDESYNTKTDAEIYDRLEELELV